MDQSIAVRLANEGVPVRVIARAVKSSSADIRSQLEEARLQGQLLDLPSDDWPVRPASFQAPLRQPKQVSENILQFVMRSLFKLSPVEVQILLLLLQHNEVDRGQIYASSHPPSPDSTSLYVHIFRLRTRLAPYDLKIESIYGYGYRMPVPDRRKLMDMGISAAAEIRRVPWHKIMSSLQR